MARFRHEIELSPLPRPWLDHAADVLYDVAEELRFDDEGRLTVGGEPIDAVRVTKGKPHTDGAHNAVTFEDGQADVEVAQWRPSGVTRLRLSTLHELYSGTASIEVGRESGRLRALRVTGSGRGRISLARLLRVSLEAEADLRRWWAQAAERRASGPPPLTVDVKAGPIRARWQAGCRKASGGWAVTSELRLTGRGPLRPLAAAVLLFTRRRVKHAHRKALNGFVPTWQDEFIPMLGTAPAEYEPLALRHEKTVTAIPRPWLDEFAAALHRELRELEFEHGRLVVPVDDVDDADDTDSTKPVEVEIVKGRHLAPGARYRVRPPHGDEMELHLVSMSESGETRIEVTSGDGERSHTWSAALRNIGRPETLAASGERRRPGPFEALSRSRWRLNVDLSANPRVDWSSESPFEERNVKLTARTSDGEWTVTSELGVEGRDAGRAALRLVRLLNDETLAASYAAEVDHWASEWESRFGQLATFEPAEAAATVLHELLNPPPIDIAQELERLSRSRLRPPERGPGQS